METSRKRRISDEVWEQYKCIIQRLYLEEDRSLEGEESVSEAMKRDHKFFAR